VTTNLTIAVDKDLLDRARAVARAQGTSVNALVRDYLERLAGRRSGKEVFEALQRLWAEGRGCSDGSPFRREEVYEERLGRYGKDRG
jgi:hypothetical protein